MTGEHYQSPMEPWPEIEPFGKKIFLDKSQLCLFYFESGQGNPNHLFLIHGLGDEADTWRHIILPLSEDYHVIALDLPGFGRSDKPERVYSPQFFIDTIQALMDNLSIEKAFFVGSSLGGMLAQGFAIGHPDRVSGLILIGGTLLQKEPMSDMSLRLMRVPILGEWLYTWLRKNPDSAFDSLRSVYHDLDGMPQKDKDFLYQRVNQRVWSDGQRLAYLSTLRNLTKWVKKSQDGLAEKLSTYNLPTLIVRGEFDPLFPEINADALAQTQKNTDKVVIHATGHLPHQENPEAFVNAILMWLSDQT